MDALSEEGWMYSVGVQNYVFGLPLVIFERERKLRLDPVALEKAKVFAPAAPINQIGHMKTLATADDVMLYTPNNDTVYSGAVLELVDEPMILTAPDILDRYWSVEVADCYTNNLFYIGTRATGGKGGNHAFVGPNWEGAMPKGVVEHRLPNNSVMFAVRIGVLAGDPADLKAVNALQERFSVTSLSGWGDAAQHGNSCRSETCGAPGLPRRSGLLSNACRLGRGDSRLRRDTRQQLCFCSRGNIDVGKPFNNKRLNPAAHKGLARAAADGPTFMKWKVKFRGTPYPTRWNNLRPGTYGVDYFDRAAGALEGLFVHDRDEAEYFSTYEDGDAHLLDGKNNYILHFNKEEIPPTLENGFWSITMYGSDFQLVKNRMNQFSIGDRTEGIVYGWDGSLDIHIQKETPRGRESNWLPCPTSGLFRLNYRIYLPQEIARQPETLGNYLPPVTKVE